MPALPNEIVTDSGDVTDSSGAYQLVCETSTLAAGRYLVIFAVNYVNLSGSGAPSNAAEVEARQGSTRVALARFSSIFGSFARTANPGGGVFQAFAVLDLSGSETLSLYVRGYGADARSNGGTIQAVNIDALTEGDDYWYADSASGDTSEVVAVGSTWVEGDPAGQLTFTVPSDGDYLFLYSAEGAIDGTPDAVEEEFRARARINVNSGTDDLVGTETETYQDASAGGNSLLYGPSFVNMDVLPLLSGDDVLAFWEFANASAGDATGYRRTRVMAFRLDAFADYDFVTNAGNIQCDGSAADVEGTNAVTFNYGSADVLILAVTASQSGDGNWGNAYLHRDSGDILYPPQGRMWAFISGGTDGTDSIANILLSTILSASGSETFRLHQHADSGASTYTLGRTRGNTASTRGPLLALQLATAASGPTSNTSGTISAAAVVAASVVGRGQTSSTVDGASTFGAFMVGRGNATASVSGQAGVLASVRGRGAGVASVDASGVLTADFRGRARFTATVSAIASVEAVISNGTTLRSTIASIATFSAALRGRARSTATCAATATFTADFRGLARFTANIGAAANVSSAIASISSTLSAVISGTATIAADFRGRARFTATLAGTFELAWLVTSNTPYSVSAVVLTDSPYTVKVDLTRYKAKVRPNG